MLATKLVTSLAAAVLMVGQATATRFCQCENPKFNRIFPGINNICNQLPQSDWCSTNCDMVGGNCNYCQFKPRGGGKVDISQLKAWCGKQYAFDLNGKTYHGDTVYCYSYAQRAKNPWYSDGCTHENNGDDDPAPSHPPPEGVVDVRIDAKGSWIVWQCYSLYKGTTQTIGQNMLAVDTCKTIFNEPEHVRIGCQPASAKDSIQLVDSFRANCSEIGGGTFGMQQKSKNHPKLDVHHAGVDATVNGKDETAAVGDGAGGLRRELRRSVDRLETVIRSKTERFGASRGAKLAEDDPSVTVNLTISAGDASFDSSCSSLTSDSAHDVADMLTDAYPSCQTATDTEEFIQLKCAVPDDVDPEDVFDNFAMTCMFDAGDLELPDDDDMPDDGDDGDGGDGAEPSDRKVAARVRGSRKIGSFGRQRADCAQRAEKAPKRTVVLDEDGVRVVLVD